MRVIFAFLAVSGLFVLFSCLPGWAESVSQLQINAEGYMNSGNPDMAEKELLKALELEVLEGSTRIQLARLLAEKKSWGMAGLLLKPVNVPWNSWSVRADAILKEIPAGVSGYQPVNIPAELMNGAGQADSESVQLWKKEVKNELQWYLTSAPRPDEGPLSPANSPLFTEFYKALEAAMAGSKRDYAAMLAALARIYPEFAPRLAEFRKTLKLRWHQWSLDSFQAVVAMSRNDDQELERILSQWPGSVGKILFLDWVQGYAAQMMEPSATGKRSSQIVYPERVRRELADYSTQSPLLQSLARGLASLEKSPRSEEGKREQVEALDFAECEKLAVAGDSYAQFQLGNLYSRQSAEEGNLQKAMEWYSKAAEQGDSYAQFRLAEFYEEGKVSAADADLAFKWYFAAAKKGHASAQKKISDMYRAGNGTSKNEDESRAWLVLSSDLIKKMAPDEFKPVLLKQMTEDQLEKALKRSEEMRKEFAIDSQK